MFHHQIEPDETLRLMFDILLEISQVSASIFLKNIFLYKEKCVLRISNQAGDGKGDVIYKDHSRSSKI